MAGAVFGEVQVSFFVAGAALREIWNDSPSAKCCIFQLSDVSYVTRINHESHFPWQAQFW